MTTEDLYTPPFHVAYKSLLDSQTTPQHPSKTLKMIEECELPVIDLSLLDLGDEKVAEKCRRDIARASSEWGFFQILNHGIPSQLITRMCLEQENIFRQPFEKKAKEVLPDFSADSYRWGVPTATCIDQLSWSEAYHIPLTLSSNPPESNTLRSAIDDFSSALSAIAHRLAMLLSKELGYEGTYFEENCTQSTCYLRLNRYPPCPASAKVNGMTPHTDSDFLTILYQDQVGGLQVMQTGRWIAVKPNIDALVVNIGDLFQVWSNGRYKSVEHRVVSNPTQERFSVAYFFCPLYDATIQNCCNETPVYKQFSFREYREKVQEDVRLRGYKVGLPRFLA